MTALNRPALSRGDWKRDALVLGGEGRALRLRLSPGGEEASAHLAFSCLVRPETGDVVMTEEDGSGQLWVTAILERSSGQPAQLFTEGDLELAAGGDVGIHAGGTLRASAGAKLGLTAPVLELHAAQARFLLDELLHAGRQLTRYVEKFRHVGELVEQFATHVLVRAKRATRFIEEREQLRAGEIDHAAEGTLHLQAETAFLSAETVVRLDAENIHMG